MSTQNYALLLLLQVEQNSKLRQSFWLTVTDVLGQIYV